MKKEEIISQLKEAQEIIDRCVLVLGGTIFRPSKRTPVSAKKHKPVQMDFSLNERNFVKTYGAGLDGQRKFVLLLAYIAKGKTGVDVEIGTITSMWNKMTAKELLGYAFNDKYPTAAKTNGWVNSNKRGTYHLRDTWLGIIF